MPFFNRWNMDVLCTILVVRLKKAGGDSRIDYLAFDLIPCAGWYAPENYAKEVSNGSADFTVRSIFLIVLFSSTNTDMGRWASASSGDICA